MISKNHFLNSLGLSKLITKIKNFVKPNPTLTGTEPNLDGIEIDDVKYKMPDEVVANPTIPEGVTPTALSDLKIGSNYFSAGGSEQHLYWHSIYINAMDLYKNKDATGLPVNYAVYLIILSTSSVPVTWEYLKQLMDNGATLMVVSGWVEEKTIDAFSMYYAGSPYYRYTIYTNSSTSGVSGGAYYWKNDASPSTFTDTVNQIF